MRGGLQGVSAVLIITLVQGSLSMYENKRRVFNHKPFARNEPVHTMFRPMLSPLQTPLLMTTRARRNMHVEVLKNDSPAKSTSKQKLRFAAHTLHYHAALQSLKRSKYGCGRTLYSLCLSHTHTHTCAHVRTLNADLQQNTVRL